MIRKTRTKSAAIVTRMPVSIGPRYGGGDSEESKCDPPAAARDAEVILLPPQFLDDYRCPCDNSSVFQVLRYLSRDWRIPAWLPKLPRSPAPSSRPASKIS